MWLTSLAVLLLHTVAIAIKFSPGKYAPLPPTTCQKKVRLCAKPSTAEETRRDASQAAIGNELWLVRSMTDDAWARDPDVMQQRATRGDMQRVLCCPLSAVRCSLSIVHSRFDNIEAAPAHHPGP